MIIPYTLTNKQGQKNDYWTHTSFIDKNKFDQICQTYQQRCTYRNYLGLAGLVLGLKLSHVPAVSKSIPKQLHPLAFSSLLFGGFYLIGQLAFVGSSFEKDLNRVLEQETIPLWKQKNSVVNMDRIFFHLDETKNNTPNILHHGLTADSAAKIYPDVIIGALPKSPEKPHGHHDDHHHGKH